MIPDTITFRGELLPVFLVCFFVFFMLAACAAASQYSLVREHRGVPPGIGEKMETGEGMFAAATRVAQVGLSDVVTTEGGLAAGDVLIVNLFDDRTYRAVIDRTGKDAKGTLTLRGRLENYPTGYILITSGAGRSLVHVRIPEENREYTIFFDPATRSHYLLEIDPSKKEILEEGPALIPPKDD